MFFLAGENDSPPQKKGETPGDSRPSRDLFVIPKPLEVPPNNPLSSGHVFTHSPSQISGHGFLNHLEKVFWR